MFSIAGPLRNNWLNRPAPQDPSRLQESPDVLFSVLGAKKYEARDRQDWLPKLESQHRQFYRAQKFTLNITRADTRSAGYAPSVRLFEAAACGIPIISDTWEGFETFFSPGKEILLVSTRNEVIEILRELPDRERAEIGARARERVLKDHTSRRRAEEFSAHLGDAKNELPTEAIS